MRHLLIGLVILLSSGCSEKSTNLLRQEPLRIALMLPLSGTNSHLGQSIAQAAKMATQDHPESQVNLQIIDTGSEAAIDPKALKHITSNKFPVILGPLFATHTKSVQEAVGQSTTIISFSNDTSLLGKQNTYIAGLLPEQQIERITHYAAANGYKELYAILPSNRYGELVAKTIEKDNNAHVYNLKTIAYYNNEETMMNAVQQVVDATMPKTLELESLHKNDLRKAILIPEGGAHLGELIHYLDQIKGDDYSNVKFLGSSQWHHPDILSIPTLQGAWLPSSSPTLLYEFKERYRKMSGTEPFDIAILGYDLTTLLLSLSSQPKDIKAALEHPDGFRGFAGTFRFTRSGITQRNLSVLEIKNGHFIEVEASNEWF